MEECVIREAADRIRRMEQCFNELQSAVDRHPAAISENALLQDGLKQLTRYYESGQWLRDYELDERGHLPHDLKRGVLSQDAVYDFLERLKDLQNSEVRDESAIYD